MDKYELDSYSRNQWVAPPSGMLTKAIQEKLLQSCSYNNVVSADFMTSAKYRLNSQLIELKQKFEDNNATMNLAILVQLVDNSSNQVVKSKTFIVNEKVTPNQAGYVVGANQAVEDFLSELVLWLK